MKDEGMCNLKKPTIAVYCGSNNGARSQFTEVAKKFGAWLGEQDFNVVYGGSSVGLMGCVSREAMAHGAHVIGVEPQFFIDAGVEQHDLDELIVVNTMGERKARMIELADAYVALPGGVGTLEEISEIMARVHLQLNTQNHIDTTYRLHCHLLNLEGFYDGLRMQLKTMLNNGFVQQDTFNRIHFPTSLQKLQEDLLIARQGFYN